MHSRCHATPAQLKTLTELVLDHCRAAGIEPKTAEHEDVAGFVMHYFLSGISDADLISELLSLRRKQFLPRFDRDRHRDPGRAFSRTISYGSELSEAP